MENEENEIVEFASIDLELSEISDLSSALNDLDYEKNPLIAVIEKAISIPGVKINRTQLLMSAYHVSGTDVESDDFFETISLEQMDKAAQRFINENVTKSSATAFALGLPGGFAMVATIPADVMQTFGFSLRLSQQLAYIYGFDDLFSEDGKMSTETQYKLVSFMGIMFAVAGSGTALRAIAPNVGKYVAKQFMKSAPTKGVIYPMIKKIGAAVFGKSVTKKGTAGVLTKAVPVAGGVISAGINVATMIPMANRLKYELRKYHMSEEELQLLEEKEQREKEEKEARTFADSTSDALASVAAGSVKAAGKVKDIGKSFGDFAQKVSTKTKEKIDASKDKSGDDSVD